MPSPMASSTPFRGSQKYPLNEKKGNVPMKSFQQNPKNYKPKKTGRGSNETKENGEKTKSLLKETRLKRQSKDKDEKRDALRRQQALDAMKLAEQRRLRMEQQSLTEIVTEETLSPIANVRDELEEKKRLEAKRSKEKRIQAYLAEQTRKKEEAAKPEEAVIPEKAADFKSETFKAKSEIVATKNSVKKNDGKMSASNRFRSRFRFPQRPMNFNPIWIPRDFIPSAPPMRVETFARPAPSKLVTFHDFLATLSKDATPTIRRYSKDDLRALNPYGYYFL